MKTMDKVIDFIAVVASKIDDALYKTFGFVSLFRKKSWNIDGKRLQRQLDREHIRRDYLNRRHCTNYTTKQALALHKD